MPFVLRVDPDFINSHIQRTGAGELLKRAGISREQGIKISECVGAVEGLVIKHMTGEAVEVDSDFCVVGTADDRKIVDKLIGVVAGFESDIAPRTRGRR